MVYRRQDPTKTSRAPVLTQIIVEEEGREGQNLLPIQFLRQLIRFYGDQMQAFVPSYLEMSLESFTKQQERFRSTVVGATSPSIVPGIGAFDEQIRQNMAMFDRAMKMFSPFAFVPPRTGDEPEAEKPPEPPQDDSLAELKRQVEAMRDQIDKLASKT